MTSTQSYAAALLRLAPEFEEAIELARALQASVAMSAVTSPSVPRAARLILALAASDLGDLFDEALRGSGRAATRSARSILEHTINMHTVIHDPAAAQRYMDHLDHGPVLMQGLIEPLGGLLSQRLKKSMQHAARKAARDAQPRWTRAVARHGNWFNKTWHQTNLYDRSESAGRPDLYDYYRLASAVIHGSGAGALGQYRFHEQDEVASYAVGRAPALVPTALAFGVESYLQLLAFLEDAYVGEVDAMDAGSAARLVVADHLDGVARAVEAASATIGTQGEFTHYLAFSQRGMRRWYVRVGEISDAWFRAIGDVPSLSIVEDWLAPVMSSYFEIGGDVNEAGIAALEVPGLVPLRPNNSLQPIPAGTMPTLRPSDDGWYMGEEWLEGIVFGTKVLDELVDFEGLINALDAHDAAVSNDSR